MKAKLPAPRIRVHGRGKVTPPALALAVVPAVSDHSDCIYRGEQTDEATEGGVTARTFRCALYGKCTSVPWLGWIQDCPACRDYVGPGSALNDPALL